MISYNPADDIKMRIEQLVNKLGMEHIDTSRLFCIRSHGSSSKGIIARCHALPKIMQQCLSMAPIYIIEVISENFDNLNEEEKIKTLIHELLHIPKSFGGGFIHHDKISKSKVDKLYFKFNQINNQIK